jgi:hypothetical protein
MTAAGLAASLLTLSVPAVHAGSHFTPPGIQPCFNLGNAPCPPPGPGGFINPPAPPGPGGGGGGGFGSGLGAGIGLGVGLGIVNSLTQPRTVIVQQQPTYVAPAPQVIHTGISAHDQFCLNKFNSYNVQTKRYLSFSGKYKLCLSPYM